MFDAVSSHGKAWLDKRFKGSGLKRRRLLEPRLKALAMLYGEGRVPEDKVLTEIAGVLAATSAPRWAEKVRRRKLWFVTGRHPRAKELHGLEPSPTTPYALSGSAGEAIDAQPLDEASVGDDTPAGEKSWFQVSVAGFEDGETELAHLLARRPATAAAAALTDLVDAVYEAEHLNPNGAKFCTLLVHGHADRDDTTARSGPERRAKERDRALARAKSAKDWLLQRVNLRAQAAGKPHLQDWGHARHVYVFRLGVGASNLACEPPSPAGRSLNRRVTFTVQGHDVAAITRRNGQNDALVPDGVTGCT
jgi:hypothetical protein